MTLVSNYLARCVCGQVAISAAGNPIATNLCYCDDCQSAARQLEALPGAPRLAAPDGGTAYMLFRKDRVACVQGRDLLKPVKLREGSATFRMVAECCNSPMHMGFEDGRFWVSAYRARFQDPVPPIEMRICTRFWKGDGALPTDLPASSGYPPRMMMRLIAARIAMLVSPGKTKR